MDYNKQEYFKKYFFISMERNKYEETKTSTEASRKW